jgi:hypothetical protein
MFKKAGRAASLFAAVAVVGTLVGVVPASAVLSGPNTLGGGPTIRETIYAGPVYVPPGVPVEYGIIVVNTTDLAVQVGQVVVRKAGGFTYVAGSTEGGIIGDPTISGNNLTWFPGGPAGSAISIAPEGALQFEFQADSPAEPAPNPWYFSRVSITLTSGQVFRSSLEAPVNVSANNT